MKEEEHIYTCLVVPVAVPEDVRKWPLGLLYPAVVWGEARGEPYEGKVAVAWVIKNRQRANGWFGETYKDVILKPRQFSCLNPSDPNYQKIFNPTLYDTLKTWLQCCGAVVDVVTEKIEDPTNGATHYHRKDILPGWAKKMQKTCEIGSHVFYRK